MNVFLGFTWQVLVDGYRWVQRPRKQAGAAPELALRPVVAEGATRWYAPLEVFPQLYLEFASLDATPANVLAFANQYGALGHHQVRSLDTPAPSHFPEDPAVRAERFETYDGWRVAVQVLNFLVTLWEAAKAENLEVLNRLVARKSGRLIPRLPPLDMQPDVYRAHLERYHPLSPWGDRPEDDLDRLYPGDLLSAARHFVMFPLNKFLHLATPRLVWEPERAAPILRVLPHSLLEALYFLLATAIDGGWQHRQCVQCRKWFLLTPGVSRSDRTTCSDTCRVRLSRVRRERVLELHAQGKTAREIAQATGSKLANVKKWIARNQGA